MGLHHRNLISENINFSWLEPPMTQGFYLSFYSAHISLHSVTLESTIIALFTPKTAHPAQQSVSYVSNMPTAVTLKGPLFRRVSDKFVKQSCNGTGVNSAGQSADGCFSVDSFSSCTCLVFCQNGSWENAGTIRPGKELRPLSLILTVWFFKRQVKRVLSFHSGNWLNWGNCLFPHLYSF